MLFKKRVYLYINLMTPPHPRVVRLPTFFRFIRYVSTPHPFTLAAFGCNAVAAVAVTVVVALSVVNAECDEHK